MLKAFKKADIEGFKPNENTDTRMFGFMGDLVKPEVDWEKAGITMSWYTESGELAGIGGVIPFWKGVGEAWFLITEVGKLNVKSLLQDTLFFLNQMFEKEGFHRIHCNIACDFMQAQRFVMRCGFSPEGMMAEYGPNREHFIRYTRWK